MWFKYMMPDSKSIDLYKMVCPIKKNPSEASQAIVELLALLQFTSHRSPMISRLVKQMLM